MSLFDLTVTDHDNQDMSSPGFLVLSVGADICPSASDVDQLPDLRKYDPTALTTDVKPAWLFGAIECLLLLIEN